MTKAEEAKFRENCLKEANDHDRIASIYRAASTAAIPAECDEAELELNYSAQEPRISWTLHFSKKLPTEAAA